MSDSEKFFTRWARRKREAGDAEPERPEADKTESVTAKDAINKEDIGTEETRAVAEKPETDAGKPEEESGSALDTSKLPSIESITASTDIRPFLAPGVPSALRNAALRRAWLVDPNIRNLVVPVDYDWDFNAPGLAGFDFSPPTDAMRRYVEELFHDKPEADAQAATGADAVLDVPHEELRSAKSSVGEAGPQEGSNEQTEQRKAADENDSPQQTVVARNQSDDSAMQKDGAPQKEDEPRTRRAHGGAIPR